MRRIIAVTAIAAAAASLTACGASNKNGSSSSVAPLAKPTTSATLLAKPLVSVEPFTLIVGTGRSAVIQQNGAAVLAGGLVLGDTTTDAVQRVDFNHGVVTRMPSLAVPVHDTAGASIGGGSMLVIGGGNSAEQSVVQEFRNGAWSVAGNLPTTRSDLSAVSGSENPTVLGGYDGSSPAVGSVLMLKGADPKGGWLTLGSLPVAVRYGAAAEDQGRVYLFGGEVAGSEKDVIQRFDVSSGAGRVVAHLPVALGHMSAIGVGGKFLLLGGRTDASSGAMTDRMWWFDPSTNTLADAGRLPYAVADASVAVSGNNVYVLGGESPHPISTILKIQVKR